MEILGIHFFTFPICEKYEDDIVMNSIFDETIIEKIKSMEILIIDEIQTLPAHYFEMGFTVIKHITKMHNLKEIVVFASGAFDQHSCGDKENSFLFQHKLFIDTFPKTREFVQNFRNTSSERLDLNYNVTNGILNPQTKKTLNSLYKGKFDYENLDPSNMYIVGTIKEAEFINNRIVNLLPPEGAFREIIYVSNDYNFISDTRITPLIILKKNMRVKCRFNLREKLSKKILVPNGSSGFITKFVHINFENNLWMYLPQVMFTNKETNEIF